MPGQRPANFSWAVDGVLAGSAYPEHPKNFQYFLNQGIHHVITLSQRKLPMQYAPPGLTNLFLPIEEFDAPSLEQIQQFVDYVDEARSKKEACVAHCYWGRGRTGTMLAAYLVKDQDKHPRDAIDEIRRSRPYSVETYEQEAAVFEYAQHLKRSSEAGDH